MWTNLSADDDFADFSFPLVGVPSDYLHRTLWLNPLASECETDHFPLDQVGARMCTRGESRKTNIRANNAQLFADCAEFSCTKECNLCQSSLLPARRNINNFRSWVIMLARFVSLYTNKGPEDTNNNQTKLLCWEKPRKRERDASPWCTQTIIFLRLRCRSSDRLLARHSDTKIKNSRCQSP